MSHYHLARILYIQKLVDRNLPALNKAKGITPQKG